MNEDDKQQAMNMLDLPMHLQASHAIMSASINALQPEHLPELKRWLIAMHLQNLLLRNYLAMELAKNVGL